MSVAYFLAKRVHFSKGDDTQRVSPPAIRIAIAGISIGLAVMILTVAIVVGFKQEIRKKISDFGGDLQVQALASNRTFEKQPICYNDSILSRMADQPNVMEVSPFITKPAVIKTADDFLSVVIRSAEVGEREVQISETIARKLKIGVGDKVQIFFVQNSQLEGSLDYGSSQASVKTRTLEVTGLYQTHFNQYDNQIICANHQLLQQVSGWDEDMASGIAIKLQDPDLMADSYDRFSEVVSLTQDRRGTQLAVRTLEHQNPEIFGWLNLLDTNVWVILGLMIIVSTFTMVSGLMIIILEKTQMIALLKALGCDNRQLRKTFLYIALFLTLQGLLWGNLIGLGCCAIQSIWHPVALDPENYYLEWVPISITWWQVVALNVGSLCITMLMLIAPSAMIARMSPAETLKS